MKAKYAFEIMDLDDEKVAVPVGENGYEFNGVLKVNDAAVEILKLLKEETSEDQIVTDLMKEYTGNAEEIKGYVHEFIEKLITEGVVE